MGEIVKYDNYMNSLNFKGFTSVDMNMFMSLCARMKDMSTNKTVFEFSEIRKLTGYTGTSVQAFIEDVERMNKKLMQITCRMGTEDDIVMFVLFPTFHINKVEQTLTVSVNRDFKFLLNELTRNFTTFELNQFIELDRKYSKTLFRLLKQFKSTGMLRIGIEDFRAKMDIPDTYTNRDIMSKVINPVMEELEPYFENLICEPQYAKKRGKPVIGYLFTFVKQKADAKTEPVEKTAKKEESGNKKSSNSFHDFGYQRSYSEEDYKALEAILNE